MWLSLAFVAMSLFSLVSAVKRANELEREHGPIFQSADDPMCSFMQGMMMGFAQAAILTFIAAIVWPSATP